MNSFEDKKRIEDAIKAGQRNLRATELLNNWCSHSKFVRFGGIGMIEAETGFPIGHMGVQCKYVKQDSMLSWLLEDSIYSFYKENCKSCTKRIPIGFPNILEFINPREKAAEERKTAYKEEKKQRLEKQIKRQQERAILKFTLTIEETFVLDLLDEIDQENIERDDPRLEQLAKLAPETFTNKIIDHLLPDILYEKLPYSIPAAKALIETSLSQAQKLPIAVYLAKNNESSLSVIDIILQEAQNLHESDFIQILLKFTRMAIEPPPEIDFVTPKQRKLNNKPIQSLFQVKRNDIFAVVDTCMKDKDPNKIQAAIEIILAIDNKELLLKNIRNIFANLIRRQTLLPEEKRDSSIIHYLRRAAKKCLDYFPEESDKIIQSYLTDKNDIGRYEANKVYQSAFKHSYKENVEIGKSQKIAFRRLLWTAVEHSKDAMDNAGQFLRHSTGDKFYQLAIEKFDDLIGAAATLSEKYELLDKNSILEITENIFDQEEKNNQHRSIDSLQKVLIKWAAIGAKHRGCEGIEDFLSLYRNLPKEQVQMRGNMIAHAPTLLTGIESLTLVLPDWYSALMDGETLIRARAAQAWENVPRNLVKNFPDLFFEAYSVLLLDQYVMVHKSAVHSLRRRPFPNDKKHLIKFQLWTLISHYAKLNKQDNFIVECIDVFSSQYLSDKEKKENIRLYLSKILLSLEGIPLYEAIDKLHYHFNNTPDFTKVALKAIQDKYVRNISIDKCLSIILKSTPDNLRGCKVDLQKAFNALKPSMSQHFTEALVYITALIKLEDNVAAEICFKELLKEIPKDDRNAKWRLETKLISEAARIEHAIDSSEPYIKLIENWNNLAADLEKENAG